MLRSGPDVASTRGERWTEAAGASARKALSLYCTNVDHFGRAADIYALPSSTSRLAGLLRAFLDVVMLGPCGVHSTAKFDKSHAAGIRTFEL